MEASFSLPQGLAVKREFHSAPYWVREIAQSLVIPLIIIIFAFLAHQATWQTTLLPALLSGWWFFVGYGVIWCFWLRFIAKRHAFAVAAETVRQAAAAHDDLLTDAYYAAATVPELLPVTLSARPRAPLGLLLSIGGVAFNLWLALGISSSWGGLSIQFLRIVALGVSIVVSVLVAIGYYRLGGSAFMRTTITADYAGITMRRRFTRRFMAWSDVRLFYAPTYATITTPIGLEGKLLRRIRYLREHDAATITEAIELEHCQLANGDRIFTFPALRDTEHVPINPKEHDAQVQRLITAIMQQTGLPLRMPSAEGVRFVAESLPFASQWFKDQLAANDDDAAVEDAPPLL